MSCSNPFSFTGFPTPHDSQCGYRSADPNGTYEFNARVNTPHFPFFKFIFQTMLLFNALGHKPAQATEPAPKGQPT